MKCFVNIYEVVMCYCIWTSMIIWTLYELYKSQTELFLNTPNLRFPLKDLTGGWFLDRYRDASDVEWRCWKLYMLKSWMFLILQFVISETLRKFTPSMIKYWYILSSMFLISFSMGVLELLMLLIQPIVFFALLLCGRKRTSIWVTGVVLLLMYNTHTYVHYFWKLFDNKSSQADKVYLPYFAVFWIKLRCISFCIDYIEKREMNFESGDRQHYENVLQSATNLVSYVLYMPVLYTGPMILYKEFEDSFQRKSEALWTRLKRFAVDMILYISYSWLLELANHFIYFNAMRSYLKMVQQLPSVALVGGGFWMCFAFYTKYVIFYGTTSAFARLDNIDAPPPPRCIARIHLYTEMWKYFDVGLYKFMVKYIYVPCCEILCKYKKLSNFACTRIASFNTFVYMYLWHGMTLNVFVWCSLNYCVILLEYMGKAFSKTAWYTNFKKKFLKTRAMEIRFSAFLCAFLLPVSGVSNCYFFGGAGVGHLFTGLFKWPIFQNVILLLMSTYCCSHVSISLLDVPTRSETTRSRVKVE